MRPLLLRFACWALAALTATAAPPLDSTLPTDQRRSLQREALLVIELLQGLHYSDRPFRELDARELLHRHLETLDGSHLMFTAPEVDFICRRFERNLKAVYLFKGDLHPAFEIWDQFSARALDRFQWVDRRLREPFDFTADDRIATDRREAAWPADGKEADALWSRWLRFEVLEEVLQGRNLTAAAAEVRRRYAERRRQIDPLRVREQFFNTLLEIFDPHSGYFSRDTAREFDTTMSGAVVGIGIDLRSIQGRYIVETILPGGPADRCGKINPGDQLVSVTEAGGTPVETSGRRLREVVQLISGQPGTTITLAFKPQGAGTVRNLTLERSRVEIAHDHAHGDLAVVSAGDRAVRIGVVTLPAFYGTTEEGGRGASVSRDVRELLDRLAARGAEGMVVDLRDNGGGRLDEAVDLAGLFIHEGPVLLVHGLDGKIAEHRGGTPAVAFARPLVVLTSRGSASASEGFAGALQACRRAVIVGADSTFGKGTVQDFIDLRKLANGQLSPQQASWGVLRVTRQKFYLPDGSTPQQKGVLSDIVLPTHFSPEHMERDLPHALAADSIPAPARTAAMEGLAAVTDALLQDLRAKADARRQTLPEFAWRKRAIDSYDQWAKRTEYSLQREARQREHAAYEETRAALRQERLDLAARVAYETSSVDLAAVAENNRLHQEALRARTLPDGSPCVNHFFWNVFYYEPASGGPIREVRVDRLDLDTCASHRASLAEEWLRATGQPLSDETGAAILADLRHRRQNLDEATDIPTIFRERLGPQCDEATLSAGMDAFFRATIELDDDVLHDRPLMDVPLRESLRVAADWVRSVPAPAVTGPPLSR